MMKIVLDIETNISDLVIDFIEIKSKEYGDINITWDESWVSRESEDSDKQRHYLDGVSFKINDNDEDYANGKINAFDDFEFSHVELYSEQDDSIEKYARLVNLHIEDGPQIKGIKYDIPVDLTIYNN